MAFSRAHRQAIIDDFARRHNGLFDPKLFLREVEEEGEDHAAYEWFEWDDDQAAYDHRLWQARSFAIGLRIKFSVETISRDGPMAISVREMPFAISPVADRQNNGGYLITNPIDAEHQAEHRRQAVTSLRTWLRRYGACEEAANGLVEEAIRLLDENVASVAA